MRTAAPVKPATQKQKVKFVCPAGYNLQLVMHPLGRGREVDGHWLPSPAHSINFTKEGYLPDGVKRGAGFWRGVYVTDRKDDIRFIRNHDWFRSGPPPEPRYENGQPVNESAGGTTRFIYEIPFDPEASHVPGPDQVIRRGEEKGDDPEPEPPMETSPDPIKARVGKSIKSRA